MGLFSKLKSEPKHSHPGSVSEKSSPKHSRIHKSVSSIHDSDFSTTGSDSSYTSNESQSYGSNLAANINLNRKLASGFKSNQPVSKLHYQRPSSVVELEERSMTPVNRPILSKSVPSTPSKSASANGVPVQQKLKDNSKSEFPKEIPPKSQSPRAPVSQPSVTPYHPLYAYPHNLQSQYNQFTPQPSAEVESEYSDTSDESESESEPDDDSYSSTSLNSNQLQEHPYYEQWRQYYAAIATRQQLISNSNSMFGGGFPGYPIMQQFYPGMMPPMQFPFFYPQYISVQHNPYLQPQQHIQLPHQQITQPVQTEAVAQHEGYEKELKNDYLYAYNKNNSSEEIIDDNNQLLSNSRKSTIKSNRFPSVPSISLQNHAIDFQKARVSSLDLNFKPKEFHEYKEEDEDEEEDKEDHDNKEEHDLDYQKGKSTNNDEKPERDACKSIAFGLSDLALEDKPNNRYISDYNKFFFEDESDDEEDQTIIQDKPLPINPADKPLERHESKASTASYNSIQTNGSAKFKVISSSGRLEKLQYAKAKEVEEIKADTIEAKPLSSSKYKKEKSKEGTKHSKRKKSKHPRLSPIPTFNPHLPVPNQEFNPTPPPPSIIRPQVVSPIPQIDLLNCSYANSTMNSNTEYIGMASPNRPRRQSVSTIDSKRKSMMINSGGNFDIASKRLSMPAISSPPKVNDSTINRKINEFLSLRQIIASGKKSMKYRLKWVKMLIAATNYKLYAYINIKGESIQQDQISQNKALFIKSSVNHLLKLLKEYEMKDKQDDVQSEVYYIYACLLKQDYLTLYSQDFNIEKNLSQSIEYFKKCLEINPKDYRSLYELGDIYEFELPNEFDNALSYYKESAKLGYNRAIYKVSLLYLNVPSIRSINFFKYLYDLSNIDPKDIDLNDEDKNELEEVIGLASYQLGKIYEGIYPGDLTGDDDFVQRALEIAPVSNVKSLTYYNKSAKLNCLLAQLKLGKVYEFGELNRQKNPNKSIQWYLKAATSTLPFKRHPDAMLGLSRWYLHGSQGLCKHIPNADPARALMWCERAINEFSTPESYFFMGELATMGISDSNPETWFLKAYELGHQEAAIKLGYS